MAAAIALVTVDERSAGRIYNVGDSDALPEGEWIRAIATAAGWGGRIALVPGEELPEHFLPGGNTAQDLVVDTNRIRAELGFREPVGRSEGLGRAVAWERGHPPVDVDSPVLDYAAEDALLRRFGSNPR